MVKNIVVTQKQSVASDVFTGLYILLLANNLTFEIYETNNLQAKLNLVEDLKIRAEIIADLFLLQLCQTPDIFTSAIALFFQKWEEMGPRNLLMGRQF